MKTVYIKPMDIAVSESLSSIFAVDKKMVESIADNMAAAGYDEAFPVICSEVGGYIVDGHTRIAAAKRAKVKQIPVMFRKFENEFSAIEYAIRCQRHRRNLTDAELLRCIREVDKRMTAKDAGAKGAQGCAGSGRTSEETANVVGVSARKVEQARTVIDHAPPDVKAKLDTGELTINAAYKETQAARNPKPDPVEIVLDTSQADYDRYDQQLRQVATAKPREQWPTIARVMRDVAAWLDEQSI